MSTTRTSSSESVFKFFNSFTQHNFLLVLSGRQSQLLVELFSIRYVFLYYMP